MGYGEGSGEGWGEGEGHGSGTGMGEAEWKHGLFGCLGDGGNCKLTCNYKIVFIIVLEALNIIILSNKINMELSHFRSVRMVLFPLFVVPECQQIRR